METAITNLKTKIQKFIDTLNYDLSECQRLYAHMEHLLDLDKQMPSP
ncbi:MAG: hypothetical protein IKM43_03875 [Clostridia bacterium]|nr:hypothetical protein [Clostridia bacterium]